MERLKKQNAELQRSIDLLEHENEIKKKAAREQFVEIASSKLVKSGEAPYYSTLFGKNGTRIAQDVASRTGQNGMVASNLEMYEYYQAQLKQIDSQFKKNIKGKKKGSDEYDKIFEDYKKQREEVESDLTKTSNEIVSFISELQDISSGVERVENPKTDTDKAVNAYLDFIENYRDKFAIISGEENAKENAFNRLVNSSPYSDATQSLKKLGEQGEVTATMLSDPKYADFIQNLVDIGVVADSSEKSLAKIANAFNGTSMDFDLEGSVKKMKAAFKKIKGLIADVGETAEETSEKMHFVGKDGAIEKAKAEIKDFDKWLDELSAKDKELVYEVYCENGDALASLEEWQAAFNNHKLMIENSSSKIIAAFDSASQAATDFADSLKDIKSGTESFESYADAYKDAMELISKGADLDNGKLLAYAEYILGKDRVAELGYNVKKVKKALETVRVMYGDAEDLGTGMVARLSQVVDKSGKLLDENGETIATYNKKTGKWWVSNSHLEDVAKVLGTTKDGLAASIQALHTHSAHRTCSRPAD